ncbi:MAG: signal peptidase I [Patescibacteria group bacterium]
MTLEKPEKSRSKKILLASLDIFINLVVIIVLVLVIQRWIIAPFDVSGASMCDTLNQIDGKCADLKGEKIIINEAIYMFNDPERGDIVVFKVPETEDTYYIKRIIGLPGDTIEIKEGEIFITTAGTKKSIKIKENYLNSTNRDNTQVSFSGLSVFEVPEEHYFVMGDNRGSSADSRSCFNKYPELDCKKHPEKAFIERSAIRGKTWLIWWPLKNMRSLDKTTYPELE